MKDEDGIAKQSQFFRTRYGSTQAQRRDIQMNLLQPAHNPLVLGSNPSGNAHWQ
jgi:hypothetical protein